MFAGPMADAAFSALSVREQIVVKADDRARKIPNRGARAESVSTTLTAESSTMNLRRSSGLAKSSGR